MIRQAVMAAAILVGTAALAGASEVVDQQSTAGRAAAFNFPPYGQSFTPTLSLIDFATFELGISSATPPATAVVDVRAGDGVGGTVLGTSASTTFSNTAFATVRFDFTTPVTLVPGSLYTLVLRSPTGNLFNVRFIPSNPYAGGRAYLGGSGITTDDLNFSEGADVATAAVPEPSTFAGAGLGIAFAAGAVLRRRRKAEAA